jgi:hypothetical protein
MYTTYLVVLIYFIHTPVTLLLGDDFASILNDNLMWVKATIGADTVPPIRGFDNFNTDSIFSAFTTSFLQVCKSAVGAMFTTCRAIAIITLIQHYPILAGIITPIERGTDTAGGEIVKNCRFLPCCSSITHKTI